jgi:hypothetical protein
MSTPKPHPIPPQILRSIPEGYKIWGGRPKVGRGENLFYKRGQSYGEKEDVSRTLKQFCLFHPCTEIKEAENIADVAISLPLLE